MFLSIASSIFSRGYAVESKWVSCSNKCSMGALSTLLSTLLIGIAFNPSMGSRSTHLWDRAQPIYGIAFNPSWDRVQPIMGSRSTHHGIALNPSWDRAQSIYGIALNPSMGRVQPIMGALLT